MDVVPWITVAIALVCMTLICLSLSRTAGAGLRHQERERMALHHLLERTLEKEDAPSAARLDVTTIHAQERANETRTSAGMEVTMADGTRHKVPIPSSDPNFVTIAPGG